MNELVQMVTQKTGISEDKAQQAVQVIVGFLKNKLPAPVASQLDSFTGGSSAESSTESPGLMSKMFGGEKKAS